MDDQQDKIWRYLTIGKFIHLLSSRQLYLCRADRFEDRTEGEWFAHLAHVSHKGLGQYFNMGLNAIRRVIRDVDSRVPDNVKDLEGIVVAALSDEELACLDDTDDISQLLYESFFADMEERREWLDYIEEKHVELVRETTGTRDEHTKEKDRIHELKSRSYVSSWVGSNSQSMAMWKMYCSGDEGVAITTSKKKLQGLIPQNARLLRDHGATASSFDVIYAGAKNNEMGRLIPRHLPEGVWMSWRHLMLKHDAFSYEQEHRLVTKYPEGSDDPPSGMTIMIEPSLEEFIDRIHLPPTVDEDHWLYHAVSELIDKFGISSDKLETGPIRTVYSDS